MLNDKVVGLAKPDETQRMIGLIFNVHGTAHR
jgi:hypothetical protein